MTATTLRTTGNILLIVSILSGIYGMVYGYAGYVTTGLVFIAAGTALATTGGVFRLVSQLMLS